MISGGRCRKRTRIRSSAVAIWVVVCNDDDIGGLGTDRAEVVADRSIEVGAVARGGPESLVAVVKFHGPGVHEHEFLTGMRRLWIVRVAVGGADDEGRHRLSQCG